MTQPQQPETAPAPPVTMFRVTTYWKRPRNQPGPTQMDSRRVVASEALDWVLAELPDGAVTITHQNDGDATLILIDWAKVPAEVRYGRRA